MVKITKRRHAPFLTQNIVEDGTIAEIIERPFVQPGTESKFGQERTILTVKLKGKKEPYCWSLNNTSSDRLVEAFGEEGDLWLNKKIQIQKRIQVVKGKERNVLYAKP